MIREKKKGKGQKNVFVEMFGRKRKI